MYQKKGLSSFALKMIAVISMLVDHFGIVYSDFSTANIFVYELCRGIGRLAFPIYAFLLVEGYFHTKNIQKYICRLGVFALISEIPFDLFLSGKILSVESQNIFFTLTLGLVLIDLIDKKFSMRQEGQLVVIVCGCILAQVADFDYHYMGIVTIMMFYYLRRLDIWKKDVIGALVLSYDFPASFAMIPIHLYNGKKGKTFQYIFYWIYPIQLLIYAIFRMG